MHISDRPISAIFVHQPFPSADHKLSDKKYKSIFSLPGIFIVGAKRTAFGTFGGAFKNTSITQLQTAACKAALAEAGVKPENVDTVNIGNVLPVSSI